MAAPGGSLGSLQNTDERTIKLKTDLDHPIHSHPYTNGYNYIVVAGAPNHIGASKGNAYRFINHGIRELQKFPTATKDRALQRIFIVFSGDTTENDRSRMDEYTQNLGGIVIYVADVSQLIETLNQRKQEKRLIKKLVFYCHGALPNQGNCLEFHYSSNTDTDKTKEEKGAFYKTYVTQILEEIFDYDTEVISYGCRNGISVGGKDLTGKDAGQKNSIAQKMADHWDINVQAYEMRSNYVGRTYGTGNTGLSRYNPFASDKEVEKVQKYKKVIDKYKKESKEHEQGKRKNAPLKPENYDQMSIQYQDLIDREIFADQGDGPIMSHGAWHDPTTGDSPKGLKEGLQPYQPQEWR